MYLTKKDLLELIKEVPEHVPLLVQFPDMGIGGQTTEDDIQVEVIADSIVLRVE